MRIGVVSDTHIPGRAKNLPKALIQGLQGVDLILHAGDWVDLSVVEALAKIAPVEGVVGNNDGEAMRKRFGKKKILSLGKFRLGITHGDGARKTTEFRAWETFSKDKVDVIIFGHSHIPLQRTHSGILIFNPGSPTDKRRQPKYSYGILELGSVVKAEHYFFDDKT